MPYVKNEIREELTSGRWPIGTAGNLNFLLTNLLRRYWVNSAQNYQAINDIVGALEGAKQEFYRRIAVPYEENKIKENGDVY